MQDNVDLNDLDALSISYLNALEYCPRRFYYECALSEFLDNAHVVEGEMRHERSDSGRTTTEEALSPTLLRRGERAEGSKGRKGKQKDPEKGQRST